VTALDTASSESAGSDPRSSTPVIVTAAIAVVVAIGVVLRFYTKSDLWLDEALAVNIAHLPVRRIPTWLRHDGAPPFYYLLLHYWMKVFGTSDLSVRGLSGVFGVASLPLAWQCAKRTGGRTTAWIAVVVLAANPYAIIYATSVRMYSMEIFLVLLGILLVRRAFDDPSPERLVAIAALVAVLVYTQYWAFYLAGAVVLFLLGAIRYSSEHKAAATRVLIAVFVGLASFAPWIPTFLFQAKHTGTPWGRPVLPPTPIGETFQDFSGGSQNEGWLLMILFIVLVFVGAFGIAKDKWHIDIDLHGQRAIRWEAAIGATTLVVGTSMAYIGRTAFQSRYASIMFPFFVLLIAHGIACFANPRFRAALLAVVVVLGFIGGVRNVTTQRTTAGKVDTILRRRAKPGDIVLYCPDQLGPSTHRLAPKGLDDMTYPLLRKPELVDWVNYKAVLRRHKPAAVAQQVLARAGSRTIWYVSAPGYQTHVGTCDALAAALNKARPMIVLLNSDPQALEKQGLKEFPAP
jgi:mannosyltransferase